MNETADHGGGDEKSRSLRSRKKARRRQEILRAAEAMFADRGVDATTMTEIANAVGVSPPTVFNYFGNKDGILIALLTEGAGVARRDHSAAMPRTDTDFGTILLDLFTDFSNRTLQIASKRVWRYGEAAAIRHPTTELARNYSTLDRSLRALIANHLDRYVLRMRAGGDADVRLIGRLFHDVWNAAFFELIKDDAATLSQHRKVLRDRLLPLAWMIFDDTTMRTPTLNEKGQLHAHS